MSSNLEKNAFSFHSKLLGTILVVASGALYGFMSFFGIKLFNVHYEVSNVLFWRFFTAMLWMLGSLFFLKHREHKKINKITFLKTVVLGSLAYSTATCFYFSSMHYIPSSLAMVIYFSFPVFVVFFSWGRGDWKLNWIGVSSLLAIVIGVYLLKGTRVASLSLIGLFFASMSALFYAVYIYGNRNSVERIDPNRLTFFICLGNSIFFFIFACIEKTFFIPVSLHEWMYILMLGVVATAIPIQLLFMGLKYLSPIKVSILSVSEPLITLLVGLALLNEQVTSLQLLGIAIILLGAVLIQFEKY